MKSAYHSFTMAKKITLAGNLFIQLADEVKPQPIPLALDISYTEKSLVDYSWSTDQTNKALAQGTVTAPRFILIEVVEGQLSLSTSAAGTGGVLYAANPTPAAGDPPARGIMFTFDPATATFYATTVGPTRAKVWFFE